MPVSPYAIGASMALQAWTGIQQAEMIRMNADTQQRVNELNAQYTVYDAFLVEQYGESEIANYSKNVDQTVAAQRAGFAAQGVDNNFGTAKQIQDETKLTGFLNQMEMRKQARSKALGLKREARSILMQGAFNQGSAQIQARGAMAQGLLGAAHTGISLYSRSPSGGGNGDLAVGDQIGDNVSSSYDATQGLEIGDQLDPGNRAYLSWSGRTA